MMKINKSSSLLLKLVIIFLGLVVLAIGAVIVPLNIHNEGVGFLFGFWIAMYITMIPFYLALWEGMNLLKYIDNNTAFSEDSVKALGKIKGYAFAMSVLYFSVLPYVFIAAEMEDAPGMILIWCAFSGAPLVISIFAALLQKLLKNVIDIKSENDLTV